MSRRLPFTTSSIRRACVFGLLASATVFAVGCRELKPAQAAGSVEVLRTPNEGIQPQAVTDSRGTIHLLYFKGEASAGDLYYQRRDAGQSTWSAPVRVNNVPGSAVATGTIRGGQLALGKGGRVHVAWNGSSKAQPRGPLNPAMAKDSPYNGTPLLYTRLNDAGTAFEPQRNLMQFTYGLDGGASVAADPLGNVYVVWHGQDGSGNGEGARRLWIARSRDDGKSFSREAAAWAQPTGACACCSAKVFADRKGNVSILYRMAENRTERDMVLLTSTDTGRTFRGARIDPWQIDACPMSSSDLGESPSGEFAAWETQGQVKYAKITPGEPTPARTQGAPGPARGRKHPRVTVDDQGRMLFAWTEGTGWQRGGNALWQLYGKDGQPLESGRLDGGVPTWGLLTVVARPGGGFTLIH
jgi:hypothetical protein